MVEKIADIWWRLTDSLLLFAFGIILGWAQSKVAREKDKGVIVGRSVCVGALAMAAGTVLIWVPDLPLTGLFGVAGMLGSLGTVGLERLLMRVVNTRIGEPS